MKKYIALSLLLFSLISISMPDRLIAVRVEEYNGKTIRRLEFPDTFRGETAATFAARAREHLDKPPDTVHTSIDSGETWLQRHSEDNLTEPDIKVILRPDTTPTSTTRQWLGYGRFWKEVLALWKYGMPVIKTD